MHLEIIDPWVSPKEAKRVFGLNIRNKISKNIKYNAVVCTLAHAEFMKMSQEEWKEIIEPSGIIFDLKGIVPRGLDPLRI